MDPLPASDAFSESSYSVYIHIPFCKHRCAYCDFNTYAGQEEYLGAYSAAIASEICAVSHASAAQVSVHTIFFGGGTPTLLAADQLGSIMDAVRNSMSLAQDAEITTEANPGTVSLSSLQGMRSKGINRISLGMQSANGEELRMLERGHIFLDVRQAVLWARHAGFQNINLDLIYGVPGQSLQSWKSTLNRALELRPQHVSAYALTVEHGTPFGRWAGRGLLDLPSDDLAAEMYELVTEMLKSAGYEQYEISNWSLPGFACRHNLQYWQSLPYLGFGAGAHGYASGVRYSNALRIPTFLERVSNPTGGMRKFPLSGAAVQQAKVSMESVRSEYMLMGLRLIKEGVSAANFLERFGVPLREVFGKALELSVSEGLLEWFDGGESVRLTHRGRLLSNRVFVRFV